MKKTLLVLLLGSWSGSLTMAQQTPVTTAPATRTLTPAEQKQKEKIEREVQRERQIRAEWAQKQREYEAKQAEKARQKQAKLAEKEREQQDKEAAKTKPADSPTPVSNAPVTTPATPIAAEPNRTETRERRKKETPAEPVINAPESVPAVAEPSRREKREQRKKEEATQSTPAVSEAPPATSTPGLPVAEAPAKPARPERVKASRKPAVQSVDTVFTVTSAAGPAVARPRREFLPKGHLFEPILLDPLEAQTYGSVLPMYWTEGKKYPGSIVPFAFGFAKPFYRHTSEPGRSEEWVLDLASFTQFEAYYDYKLDKARRQIINNDYKISIIYNVRRGDNNYRFRVYHLSSHLADDYIYRNQITAPTPNSVNYEVVDVTYSRVVHDWRLYGGLGIGLRNVQERKRLSAQIGTFYKKPSTRAARLVGGVDVKFWEQTNFRPGIHGGVGIELGRTQNNLTFLVEGYSGFRPYSQYEAQQTSWMGIGLYLNPF